MKGIFAISQGLISLICLLKENPQKEEEAEEEQQVEEEGEETEEEDGMAMHKR